MELQTNRNLRGKELEKSGNIDEAIQLYEKNIDENFIGNYPYDRLAVIYRNKNEISEEIRVLTKAVWVFENVVPKGRVDRSPKLINFKEMLNEALKLKEKREFYSNQDLPCKFCGEKNPYYANFCQECGQSLKCDSIEKRPEGGSISFITVNARKVETSKKGKSKYYSKGKKLFAEEFAIEYYKKEGYRSIWSENDYWSELMSLLFWDVIFARVPGAWNNGLDIRFELNPSDPKFDELFEFVSNMNGMPSDFFTPNFYMRRKELIQNKLLELKNADLIQKIVESYKAHYGKTCRPIENWDKFSLKQLLIPVNRMKKTNFLKIMERLLYNFSVNRAGLPDLIVYNNDEMFFSEIKSENDRISVKQQEWHSFLFEELKMKVDLFLINHSERKVKNLKKLYHPPSKIVKVSFGHSTSKNREMALEFIKSQDSFFSEGEGKEQIFGAEFQIRDITTLYKILDLTSRWGTQKIEIDGEIIKSTQLRNSLWCFKHKEEIGASLDYCTYGEYGNIPNKFGCKQIYFNEFENERWQISDNSLGYVDTEKGVWIFNREMINNLIEIQVKEVKYCPLIDDSKIRNSIKKIPDQIDPKKDTQWAFISNTNESWFWREGKWVTNYDNSNFPGYNSMIGIKKM